MFENLVTTFTTTHENENILETQNGLRGRLCQRLGISDEELTIRLSKHAIGMDVTIFTTENRVSVDGHLYQSLIEGKVYSTGKILPCSITLESVGSGTVMVEIW